jgi:hypothetical protein
MRRRFGAVLWTLGLSAALLGCRSSRNQASKEKASADTFTTFADDIAFLSKYGPLKVIDTVRGGRVAVSPKYQGRVMTSAFEPQGRSLGFINRKFIEEGKTATAFDNYGGEDRFWLGPEGGQFGLYFPKGKPFEFANWQTPHAMQEGEWTTKESDATSITFTKTMTLANYAGTEFKVDILRRVAVLSAREATLRLGMDDFPASLNWVAFGTWNTIQNAGTEAWIEDKGLLSIWILGMFAPVPGTLVVVPFEKDAPGEIVNDRYFGKVPGDRLSVRQSEGFLLFKCDGQYRSKIGLGPSRAKGVVGSYSDEAKLLTLVFFLKPKEAKRYVNSMWETQKDPYGGDVINSYNDGPTEPGKASLGGFYEIETSSPAAALAPGATLRHVHQTFHFTGPREDLEIIAQKVLGVTLAQVSTR